ncbi:hypothetical protein O9X98_15490 [Agrobacterium salinitolerans]|nr:hypothetical protein [Agrobacterium salinitolerans]
MGILNLESLGKFTVSESQARVGSRDSLRLDSASVAKEVEDISYADAGRWVIEQIETLDLADEQAIRSRIRSSEDKLADLKACAIWPISAHAHMQLVHQLRHLLVDDMVADDEDADMAFSTASRWADDEVMKVNLKDPFAIADRIAASAQRLESEENCRMWPGSAYAHRKVVTELTVFLKRTRGTLH